MMGALRFTLHSMPLFCCGLKTICKMSCICASRNIWRLQARHPYGATLPWPSREDGRSISRSASTHVILVNGELAAYLSKGEKFLLTFLSSDQQEGQFMIRGIAQALSDLVDSGKRRAIYLIEIDGQPPENSPLASLLLQEGFVRYSCGWQKKSNAANAAAARKINV